MMKLGPWKLIIKTLNGASTVTSCILDNLCLDTRYIKV